MKNIIAFIFLLFLLFGCANPKMTGSVVGGTIGGAGGAFVGGIVGKTPGAIVGGATGSLLGAGVGYMLSDMWASPKEQYFNKERKSYD